MASRARAALLLALVASLGVLAVASRADAAPAVCPSPPSPYSGGNDAAIEVNGLRGELATLCAALVERLDERSEEDTVSSTSAQRVALSAPDRVLFSWLAGILLSLPVGYCMYKVAGPKW